MRPIPNSLRHVCLLSVFCYLASAGLAPAQTNTFPVSGNVGIGTTSPASTLHVLGNVSREVARFQGSTDVSNNRNFISIFTTNPGFWWEISNQDPSGNGSYNGLAFRERSGGGNSIERVYFASGGNVGIGTTSPAATLQVNGSVLLGSASTSVTSGFNGEFGNPGVASSGGFRFNKNSATAGTKIFSSYHANSGIEFYHEVLSASDSRFIFNSGNVGIGTTNPGSYKLAVNGTIHAKEVVVDNLGWPDFVFKPDYHLASLSEVEGAIKRDGHLPGIPSAAEVAAGGVSLGDMQARLLAKIEELTLHQIALEKRLAALEQENARLRQQPKP
jgi:hypothetical protein